MANAVVVVAVVAVAVVVVAAAAFQITQVVSNDTVCVL